jgi:hypothetical protein
MWRLLQDERSFRLAYQSPANNTFLSEQTNHQQPASSTFLSEQTSTGHQSHEQAEGQKLPYNKLNGDDKGAR